jgi:hypothetical protein
LLVEQRAEDRPIVAGIEVDVVVIVRHASPSPCGGSCA